MNTGYTACDGAECNQDVTKIAGEYLNVKRQSEESFRFLFEAGKPEIQQIYPTWGEVCRFSFRNIHTEKFSEFLRTGTRTGIEPVKTRFTDDVCFLLPIKGIGDVSLTHLI